MRLCWLRTRLGSNYVGHAATNDTMTLLGEDPAAAFGKEAAMWYVCRGASLIKSSFPETLFQALCPEPYDDL